MAITYAEDVKKGERFEFGKNWARFLAVLNDERIAQAERSLKEMLGVESLAGKSFLDIGSGSGLFSLAAMRLGAAKVHSLDYDPHSVACGQELRRRYFPDAPGWTVEQGSALDSVYLKSLGTFDIVYSWGVLHHTGQMWLGLENAKECVKDGGVLFIAIYNDAGWKSRVWLRIKQFYNWNIAGRALVKLFFYPWYVLRGLVEDLPRGKNPLRRYREYVSRRGMSMVHDWVDWIGGYPYEVATAQQLIDYYARFGFTPQNVVDRGGTACNEVVLRRAR